MIFKLPWELNLPKVIRVRRRQRGPKEDHGQSDRTTIVGGPDHPTIALVSRSLAISTIVSETASANAQSGLAVSASIHLAQSSPNSSGRQVRDGANAALSVISPIAGAIPVLGSPIKAAIDGLHAILDAVDQISQNKEDVRNLRLKLHGLDSQIAAITVAGPDFDRLRDQLTRRLNETSNKLRELCDCRIFQYSRVAKAISQCGRDIDSHLLEFSALNNMQLASYAQINDRRVDGIDSRTERMENNMQAIMCFFQSTMGVMQHMSMGFIYLMDATGRRRSIHVEMAGSFEQFQEAIRVHFQPETPEGKLLRRYVDSGRYDLSIDDGGRVLGLPNQAEWSRVQPGTTIVMSIVLPVVKPRTWRREYLCPFCKVWNKDELSGDSALDCLFCKRRFHVTEMDRRPDPDMEFGENKRPGGSDKELDCIRNIHLKQFNVRHSSS